MMKLYQRKNGAVLVQNNWPSSPVQWIQIQWMLIQNILEDDLIVQHQEKALWSLEDLVE